MKLNKIYHNNFLNNGLADKSVGLIIADPPYFQVKGKFDFIWENIDEYLKDVEIWAKECKRLLADNGTLIWYGHAKKIAYSQIVLDKYFNLLNSLVWHKINAQTKKSKNENMRSFIPVTERILLYSNKNVDNKTGLEVINSDFNLYRPIKLYFDKWLVESGLTLQQATKKIGSSCTHWFGFSTREKKQFAFPTKEKWDIMNSLYPMQEYEELRQEYEELRRPFNLMNGSHTDILNFTQQSHITKKFNHPTKKPENLTETLIKTCTKKGDLVFVPFAGSGTECAVSARLGRNFIGFDLNKQYVTMSNERVASEISTPKLFY